MRRLDPLEEDGSIGGLGHRVTRVWGDNKPGAFFGSPRRNLPDSNADRARSPMPQCRPVGVISSLAGLATLLLEPYESALIGGASARLVGRLPPLRPHSP